MTDSPEPILRTTKLSKASWRKQATGKTVSTVQSILGREMGFPVFSRSGDCMSNGVVEKMIGRHMVKARTTDNITAQTPKVTTLERTPDFDKKSNDREPETWFKLIVRKSAKITLVDNIFWEVKSDNLQGGRKRYTERFYELEPDSARGFKFLRQIWSTGILKEFEVNHGRISESSQVSNSTYLYTLTDLGCVQAYDLSDRRKSSCIFLRSTLRDPVKFTDMQFNSGTGSIYVVASVGGFLKTIYTIRHPPWLIESIIHIKFPVRMEIFDAGALISNPLSIEILDLNCFNDLAEETKVLISESQGHNTNCKFWPNVYEKELKKKPEVLEKVAVTNSFFGFLDSVWPPMYYARRNDNIKIGQFDCRVPLWEFNTTMFSINAFIPMPDGSPNVLFLTDDDYKLLTVKKVDNGEVSFHEIATSQPFEVAEPAPVEPPPRPSGRPQRAAAARCAKINQYMNTTSGFKVLGITYSEMMDLIAVFSCNRNDLHVVLYEAHTMTLFKRLPSVRLWPCPAQANSRAVAVFDELDDNEPNSSSRREEISKMVFEFEYEYIYANVKYRNDCEVYCLKVFNEFH